MQCKTEYNIFLKEELKYKILEVYELIPKMLCLAKNQFYSRISPSELCPFSVLKYHPQSSSALPVLSVKSCQISVSVEFTPIV